MRNSITKLDQIVDVDRVAYRPLAFFGINIEQDDENIINWVKWCKQQGFGGFNIIVGSDCEGRAHEQWINKLLHAYEVALRTAKAEGLEVWIFDDWGYPSGTAGGLVCTNPDFRLKRLDIVHDSRVESGTSVTLTVPDRYVAAGIFPAGGKYQSLDLSPGEEFTFTAEDKDTRLVIVGWNYDPHQAKSNCKSFPGDPAMSCIDMLNPEATRRFIEVMHERYYQHLHEYMGDVVKGFFYDEPFLQYQFPWTPKLPETFLDKKGYDLLSILPLLLTNIHSPRGEVIKYGDDFFDVWTDMAAENYYGELSKWCSEHGLELSGHMDLDHHLNTMSTISGHFYKNISHNHRPAVDVIWAQIAPGEYSDFPRYAGSIKYLLGRDRATSETFAGMGLGLSGDLMRFIIDHEVIRGINDFHLMYSSNKPPEHEQSPQMPNHMLQAPFGKLIYERMGLAASLGSLGEAAINVALYIPALDINRAQLSLRNVGITNAQRLPWQWVNEIAEYLTYKPIDFCYLWEEALLELDVHSGGLMTKGEQLIDTIIIPPDTTLDENVIAKLKQFAKNGGRIISVFKPIWALMDEITMCNQVHNLDVLLESKLTIETQAKISLATRSLDSGQDLCLLLNEDDRPTKVKIDFGVKNVYQVDLRDLSLEQLALSDDTKGSIDFDSMQMHAFLLDYQGELNVNETRILEKNNAVIPTNWTVQLPNEATYALVGNEFPDWASLGYPTFSGSLLYSAEFDWDQAGSVLIVADDLYSHAEIYIDDELVGKMAFRPYQVIAQHLSLGRHSIKIKVYNTDANKVCGTLALEKERYHGRFAHLAHYDRRRLLSGLLKPVKLLPVKER